MAVQIEMRFERLPFVFKERIRFLEKGNADFPGARVNKSSRFQMLVHFTVTFTCSRHRKLLNHRSINQDFHLVGTVKPLHMFIPVAGKQNLNFVLPILRERIGQQGPATGADRETINVFFLRVVGGDSKGISSKFARGSPDGQTTDLLGRRYISIEQAGRKRADSDIVESMTFLVFGKQTCRVDLHPEEVSN